MAGSVATFIDIANAAEKAGYSKRHFERLIEREGIRVLVFGRRHKIASADLEKFMATPRERHVSIAQNRETHRRNRGVA